MNIREAVAAAITEASGHPFRITSQTPVGGGSINESSRIESADGTPYFLKLNDARLHATFIAEAAGLATIAATDSLRVPRVITHGIADGQSYLVLEYLGLSPRGDAGLLGERLAALHRCTSFRECVPSPFAGEGQREGTYASVPSPSRERGKIFFGFGQDNFIGSTPQPNGWKEDWIAFWRERRLGVQLRLVAKNGYDGKLQRLGEQLLEALPAFFSGYTPQPSLLHGDLWGGNHAYLTDGTPVIFDPAVYYGDRECDIAMTELFGGYPSDFHAAYRAAWPLDAGYAGRRDLYNLYHILNHGNLFGGGYVRQAEQMMQDLLAQVGRHTGTSSD